MSQRNSEYERRDRDHYPTPTWVTHALRPHLPRIEHCIWEPACGDGQMVRALAEWGTTHIYATDIDTGVDFLRRERAEPMTRAIITNPPYDLATEFVEHALALMKPLNGIVAMLLRTDFDHAKTRAHLFAGCPAFCKRVVLTKRIMWFAPPPGSKGKSPSENHAWFIWDWRHDGPPTIAYAPEPPLDLLSPCAIESVTCPTTSTASA